MSLKYGFYNSQDHDRVYEAKDFSAIFDGIIRDGVFATIGNALMTRPGTGLEVIVGTGKAWFRHTWTTLDADLELEIPTAHGVYSRVDAVVLEVNETDRENDIKIITGTPSSSAARPTLEDYQYPLAYVTVPKNATSISAANIEIMVGRSACPFVTGILETVDIDELTSKWDQVFSDDRNAQAGEFEAWFEHLQNELDEHQAANLQHQIDIARGEIATLDVFRVGDFLNTKRADLGDQWVLCNGDRYFLKDVPQLGNLFDVTSLLTEAGRAVVMDDYFYRIINNRATLMGANYTTTKQSGCYAITGNLRADAAPAVEFADAPQADAEMHESTFVAYNETSGKYAIYVPRHYSYGTAFFYETAQDISATSTPSWERCTSSPTSIGDSVYDFVWWNGFYWASVSSGVYRCESLANDQWTKVLDTSGYVNLTFSIIDGTLYAVSTSKTISGQGGTQHPFVVCYLETPYGAWTTVISNLGAESSALEVRTVLRKIGGKYFLGSWYTLDITEGAFLSVSSMVIGGITYALVDVCENSKYYFAAMRVVYTGTTEEKWAIFRQEKSESGEIDISDASKWNKIERFLSRSCVGIDCEEGANYIVSYQRSPSNAADVLILPHAIDVITMPTISLSSEFYTYVKIAEEVPTPIEPMPLVYMDSFDSATGTLNLVSSIEEE